MSDEDRFYSLNPAATDPARIRREREKARKLRKSNWWLRQVNRGICHYCERKVQPKDLTMDHVVPLARGGTSTPGNIVASCEECNRSKRLDTPVDQAIAKLSRPDDDGETR